MAAVAALGVGVVGTAPSAQAAPDRVTLDFQQIPSAGDTEAGRVTPRWSGVLNLANNKTYFLTESRSPYIMDAIFADGRLAYCIEPNLWAGPEAVPLEPNYLSDFLLEGGNHLSGVFGGDGQALTRLLGLVMDNGFNDPSLTKNDLLSWRWDDPVTGTKLAQLVATQVLVWETTVGERDASFNYLPVDPGQNPVSAVVFDRTTQPGYQPGYEKYAGMIRSAYDQIVADVQHDLSFPAFIGTESIELTWDGNRFSKTLTDPMLPEINFSSSDSRMHISHEGDSVTFWIEADALADAPDGPLAEISVTATKKHIPSALVAWGQPGSSDQAIAWAESLPGNPITRTINFKVAAGSITVEKILGDHVDDTVTGAGIDYPGSSNWFEYTPVKGLGTDPVQTFDLIAGRDRLKVGTMTVTNNFDGTVTVSYALKQGLEGLTNDGTAHLALLNGVDELTSVTPGQQPYKMQGEQSITLSLDGLTQTVTETTGKGKDKVTQEVVKQVVPAINDIDDFIVYLHTNAKGVINTGYADYDTPFYVKVTGPSYPDGRVFPFSVNQPQQIHLAPGEYRLVEVANAQGDPLDGYWETSYSARKVTVVAYEDVPVTIKNKHDDDA